MRSRPCCRNHIALVAEGLVTPRTNAEHHEVTFETGNLNQKADEAKAERDLKADVDREARVLLKALVLESTKEARAQTRAEAKADELEAGVRRKEGKKV